MAEQPMRKTERLRIGRVSVPGARYFITACVQGREPVLLANEALKRILAAVDELMLAGDWQPIAATVMPDHVHVLFSLGDRLSLDRVISKFKSRGRPPAAMWRWQANLFEHRLRADEDSEDYAFYIFMNPYRAGLIDARGVWHGWCRAASWRWRFEDGLASDGTPPVEWIDHVKDVAARIHAGE